ncbi:hypothetical protein CRYUN_Cryun34aG0059600 [Craigia yunnanensis]
MILEISEQEGDDSGNTEAYGAIADCYTELGDLEKAGKFFDNYIARQLAVIAFPFSPFSPTSSITVVSCSLADTDL